MLYLVSAIVVYTETSKAICLHKTALKRERENGGNFSRAAS